MKARWPKVRLGEVLRNRKEFVTIDDLQTKGRNITLPPKENSN
jgi:hypothetical protein